MKLNFDFEINLFKLLIIMSTIMIGVILVFEPESLEKDDIVFIGSLFFLEAIVLITDVMLENLKNKNKNKK